MVGALLYFLSKLVCMGGNKYVRKYVRGRAALTAQFFRPRVRIQFFYFTLSQFAVFAVVKYRSLSLKDLLCLYFNKTEC